MFNKVLTQRLAQQDPDIFGNMWTLLSTHTDNCSSLLLLILFITLQFSCVDKDGVSALAPRGRKKRIKLTITAGTVSILKKPTPVLFSNSVKHRRKFTRYATCQSMALVCLHSNVVYKI